MEKWNLKRFGNEFGSAEWHGFTLQPGFWYGTNLRGQYVASSGWCNGVAVCFYVKGADGWSPVWVNRDIFPCIPDSLAEYIDGYEE